MISVAISLVFLSFLAAEDNQSLKSIVPKRQVALIIGNGKYTKWPLLKNPVNDARRIEARLKELHFEVSIVPDGDRRTMIHEVAQFANNLRQGDVALFYFAGHGVQVGEENYLIPVDFNGVDEIDVSSDGLSARAIQAQLENSAALLNIIVLDACRDNPFSDTRSGRRGLALMQVRPNAARPTFIAFATGPGGTASDNPGEENGLFTKHFVEALSSRGLGISDVFALVTDRVKVASNTKQTPWVNTNLDGRYVFWPAEPSPEVHDTKVNPKDGLRYVWVPPGSFQMGCCVPTDVECKDYRYTEPTCPNNETPKHEVTITRGFWIGQTEVTQAAYQVVTGANPSYFKGPNLPVESITWDDATKYCTNIGGRLPTEAEWEYAARAGNPLPRYGDPLKIAWYAETKERKTHEVGEKLPNAWGIYDMFGNVWEWTADRYGESYYKTSDRRDPPGPPGGKDRTLRGGAWSSEAYDLRVSGRYALLPNYRVPESDKKGRDSKNKVQDCKNVSRSTVSRSTKEACEVEQKRKKEQEEFAGSRFGVRCVVENLP